MNRKRIILAALLGVLVLCLTYSYFAMPRLEKAPPRSVSKTPRPVAGKVTSRSHSTPSRGRIDFTFLEVNNEEFPGAKRDVFRFTPRKPIIPVAKKIERPEPLPVVPDVVPEEPQVPIEVVQTSLAHFTFLGFLEKGGEKTVFLSSEGNLFLAKQGEKFGGDLEFMVENISGNLLTVRHPGRNSLIEIPLVEQQKLSASVSAPARMQSGTDSSQSNIRVFNPTRRMLRPAVPQESEESYPETIEENRPEDTQESESPAEGDVLEGEVNGSNQ